MLSPTEEHDALEGQVNGPLSADVIQRHLDDLADAVLVDVVHGEALDV